MLAALYFKESEGKEMQKGHLDAKQLESMSAKELQALAKEMGVSAGGSKKEIAARIAAAEVEVPNEDELTDEEKAAADEAVKEAAEAAGNNQNSAKSSDKLVKVEITEVFIDKTNGKRRVAGDVLEVAQERAAELLAAKVAKMTE